MLAEERLMTHKKEEKVVVFESDFQVDEPEPNQFICIDCGYEVFWYGVKPAEDRCATCAWIAKIDDPIEREKLKRFLKDG
jgi:hypothetical protein